MTRGLRQKKYEKAAAEMNEVADSIQENIRNMLTIQVNKDNPVDVTETEENSELYATLCESYPLIVKKDWPIVTEWLDALMKVDHGGEQRAEYDRLLKLAIDLKRSVADAKSKSEDLGINMETMYGPDEHDSDEEDKEFEVVDTRAPVVPWDDDLAMWDKKEVAFNTSGLEYSHRFLGVGDGSNMVQRTSEVGFVPEEDGPDDEQEAELINRALKAADGSTTRSSTRVIKDKTTWVDIDDVNLALGLEKIESKRQGAESSKRKRAQKPTSALINISKPAESSKTRLLKHLGTKAVKDAREQDQRSARAEMTRGARAHRWYHGLFRHTHLLWHTLCVGAGHESGHFHNSEHLDRLERHIQFVRSLDIQMMSPSAMSNADLKAIEEEGRLKAILIKCRRLTHITTKSFYSDLFEVLGNNRRTMLSFELGSAVDEQPMLHRLWDVLSDDTDTLRMGNLRHLTLRRVRIHGDGSDPTLHLAFVKLCQRLETLECINCRMRDWIPPVLPVHEEGTNEDNGEDTQGMPCTLKRVWFVKVLEKMSVNALFLKRFTSLEELYWSSYREQSLDAEFLQFVAGSRLKSLAVYGLPLPDESLASLMEHLPSTLTSLRLNTNDQSVFMGPRFVAAATALTSPSLSLLSWHPVVSTLTSTLVQQLLSSCDKIVQLDDPLSVDAVDLLAAPWVMSRLVKLRLIINDVASLRTVPSTHTDSGSSQNDGFDRIIYEQLSRLVSLEELVLTEMPRTGTSGAEKTSWISFLLSHGMGELKTLVHLRRLDIGGLQGLRMGANEGKWICDHWPALETLVVHPGREPDSHLRLMSHLRRNRPELVNED
ncbi:hypothetical protein B0O80DRAFT_427805 [Mortierella sp. GBAus27b]|nr:hypothetical protein B0O80DRAFT_427805 [Mortierella sp. GBAus27b]